MPGSFSRRDRKAGKNTVRWHKAFLLPMPGECVRRLSLGGHLALVATQHEDGNRHLLNDLTRILYFTFFLESESGNVSDPESFLRAEEALDRAVLRASETAVWRIEREEAEVLRPILCKYDEQIGSVSSRRYIEAETQLAKLLRSDHTVSPLKERLGMAVVRRTHDAGKS